MMRTIRLPVGLSVRTDAQPAGVLTLRADGVRGDVRWPDAGAGRSVTVRAGSEVSRLWRVPVADDPASLDAGARLLDHVAALQARRVALGGEWAMVLEHWGERFEAAVCNLARQVAGAVVGAPESAATLLNQVRDAHAALLYWRAVKDCTEERLPALAHIVYHDLPAGILRLADLTLEQALAGTTIPAQRLQHFAGYNGHLDLYHILRSAVGAAAEELLCHGCPDALSQVIPSNEGTDWSAITLHRDARRRLHDVVRNLLTNGARYCRDDLPRWVAGTPPTWEHRRVQVRIDQLPGGALAVTVEDNGIGVLPSAHAVLGQPGTMIGQKIVVGQSGFGLSSVIAKGGPLFCRLKVDAAGAPSGTIFRTYVSAAAVTSQKNGVPTTWRHVLERNAAEGFTLLPAARATLPTDLDTPV